MAVYLGIETSCDDTAVAFFDDQKGLVVHQRYEQTALHQGFGGVVPELASRDHIRVLSILIEELAHQSNISLSALAGIGYTAGPGLVGSLLVGAMVAKSLAWSLSCPSLGINHLEGHILSPFLSEQSLTFPFLSILVSGGHTLLVHVKSAGCYEILGESVDDAAGEVFDKLAKFLDLGYPGGPLIERLARLGDKRRFSLPRPMMDKKETLNFSFSGLKTAVIRLLKSIDKISDQDRHDVAASFQKAMIDCLLIRTKQALEVLNVNRVVICGGVSANRALREAFGQVIEKRGFRCFWPSLEFCSDNGAMIALATSKRMQSGCVDSTLSVEVKSRWAIELLKPFKWN